MQSTEQTSDETLRELKPILLSNQPSAVSIQNGKELYAKLAKMLQLADLVKFAKWTTTPDENENALTTAYEFVNSTKIVESGELSVESRELSVESSEKLKVESI